MEPSGRNRWQPAAMVAGRTLHALVVPEESDTGRTLTSA
jgi:hypothetical protein